MKDFFKIKIGYMVVLATLVIIAVLVALFVRRPEKPKYEPAPPEAPRLTSMGVVGYKIDFSPEIRYYEIELPYGNPVVPMVWATVNDGIELEIYQASLKPEQNEASANVLLDNGEYKNSYEIHFVRDTEGDLVLQYDDRYNFVPDYQLKNGEKFTFKSDGGNISVDENGVIRAVGVSDASVTVTAYVKDKAVDSITIAKTQKATIDLFIVAGQGNAAGEGGSKEESIKTSPGIAYTSELNDRTNSLNDLSEGREGFTPAIAERWYSLTGRKTVFLQTAVSDVSVKMWTSDGEAFKLARDKIIDFLALFNSDKYNYTLNDTYCLWLQGEWDIAEKMGSVEYITYFTNFYESIKSVAKPKLLSIIPVRSSLNSDSETHSIEPVCSAQYQLSNMYNDIRIITRIPETATIESGYIKEGNLYYTQNGYNELGKDIAFNIFSCYNYETEKSPRVIDVFGRTHEGLYKYGETVTIEKNEELRTVAVMTPLYADKSEIYVSYDNKLINYSEGGLITRAEENTALEPAEVCFKCGNIDFKFYIEFVDKDDELPQKSLIYLWEFDTLNTTEQTNLLTLSERSNAESYVLQEGKIVSDNRQVDFLFEKANVLTNEINWDIEWKGSINDNGILLGGDYTTKGYIYLAPFASNMNHSVRMVDDEGQTFYLNYNEYVEANKEESVWRINYNKENNMLTFYSNGLVVSKVTADKAFKFTFSNLFGRYGSDTANYCYTGSLDWLRIAIG